MRKPVVLVISLFAAAGCADPETLPIPGLAPPSCKMTWTPYVVTSAELPESPGEGRMVGLDLDEPADGLVDNSIGASLELLRGGFGEAWAAKRVFNARLAAAEVRWVLEVGTCGDGDEVRVVSAWAVDVDGDGVLEIVDRAVASVGRRDERGSVRTRLGVGWLPVGSMFAGSATATTAAWQRGLSLATELIVTRDRVGGRLGIGLDARTPAVLTPLARFWTERVASGSSEFAEQTDLNRDGVVDLAEMDDRVHRGTSVDLDLGACSDAACYTPFGGDGEVDHMSMGLEIHGELVAIE